MPGDTAAQLTRRGYTGVERAGPVAMWKPAVRGTLGKIPELRDKAFCASVLVGCCWMLT